MNSEMEKDILKAVSYTHLDVYKRQGQRGVSAIGRIHPACRLFSQDFSRNTIVYLPVN